MYMMATDASTIGIAHNEEVEHPDTVEMQALGFWLYLILDYAAGKQRKLCSSGQPHDMVKEIDR
jgi:hypothetical protein